MENPIQNFSMQDAMRLAGTPAGKELLGLLKSDENAMEQARKGMKQGDYEQVKKSLSQLMQSPRVRELLEEMGQNHG